MVIKVSSKVPFFRGLEGGYIINYTLQLPVLTKHEDGSTSVDSKIPADFSSYNHVIMMKALYHATCMMRTGSQHTIAYLNLQEECVEYMFCFQRVIEDYHGVDNIWLCKITSDVDAHQWTSLLSQFQGSCKRQFLDVDFCMYS